MASGRPKNKVTVGRWAYLITTGLGRLPARVPTRSLKSLNLGMVTKKSLKTVDFAKSH